MKKFIIAALVGLFTIFGVFSQENENQTEFTITILDDKIVKVFSSKNANMIPGNLITKGSGTGLVNNDQLFMGIGKGAFATVVRINPNGVPQNWELNMGNPGLCVLGNVFQGLGCISLGVGLGLGIMALIDNNMKDTVGIGLGCAAAGGLCLGIGIPLRIKNRPVFTKKD